MPVLFLENLKETTAAIIIIVNKGKCFFYPINLPRNVFLRECRGEQGAPESAFTISSNTLGDITNNMICNGHTAARRLLFSANESSMSKSCSQHLDKSALGHFYRQSEEE